MSLRLLGSQSITDGKLHIAGIPANELAKRYGTPLYLFDSKDLRATIREFAAAATAAYENSTVAYASKANSALAILQIIREEGLDIDVASEGELEAAIRAGFPATSIHLHGSYKSDREIHRAVQLGIQAVVIDNLSDITRVAAECEIAGRRQGVLLRIAPGVDPDTHKAISTGQEDTKFGLNIADGSATHALEILSRVKELDFLGYHFHVGSQLLDADAVEAGAARTAEFAIEMIGTIGEPKEINCGGGLGVRYLPDQVPVSPEELCGRVAEACLAPFRQAGLPLPRIAYEPGRHLVAEAGTTLYTVGPIKTVPIGAHGQYRRYLSVDGGLADNPRPQLYGANYYAINADRAEQPHDHPFRIAGRHCETDTLIPEADLPAFTKEGDILAVQCTGAYNLVMASNYNRYPRPALVIVGDGEPFVAVERESVENLFTNERTRMESKV